VLTTTSSFRQGAVCTLSGAIVKGSIKALEYSTLFTVNPQVGGNIDGDNGEVVQLISTTVGGSVQIKEREVDILL
jgi:hypothetical protein